MQKFINKETFLLLLLFLFTLLFIYLFDVLTPFFIGILVAYLLDPIVDGLEKLKIKRGIGSFFVLLVFFIVIFIITFLILPVLYKQISSFMNEFPSIMTDIHERLNILILNLQESINISKNTKILDNFGSNLSLLITSSLNKIITSSAAILNIITLLLVTPFVSWYFLKEWDKINEVLIKNIPKNLKKKVMFYFTNINIILDSYIRGQIMVSLSLCLYYFLAFYLVGLDNALFVGIFIGFISFIPMIGIIIGFLISSLLAYLQFVDLYFIIYILLIFFIGQLLEANFLTPKLIGKKLGLHPLTVLLSIFIFGSLFGILGIIFALPITAILIFILKKNL